jgi:hypothetical protein
MADNRLDITMAASFGAQYTEAVLSVVVGDALDEASHYWFRC